jgi:hypothetical protein
MLPVVVDKFCEGKVLDPCFRVGLAIDPQICFQFLIKTFGLSISLQMVGGRGCDGVIKELSKSFREFGDKLRATIGDDLVIKTKSSINVLEEKLGYPFRSDCFLAWSNNYPLHKAVVNHDHNRIKTTRGGKIRDEID